METEYEYNDIITVERGEDRFYFIYENKVKYISFEKIKSGEMGKILQEWTKTNKIFTKDINLVLPMTNLHILQKEIPILDKKERLNWIENFLKKFSIYNSEEHELIIKSYIDGKYEKNIFIFIEKSIIERETNLFEEMGYKLRTIDSDFNLIPYYIPNNLDINRYLYISYGKNFVGIVIYSGYDIVFIKNIKLIDESLSIYDKSIIVKNNIKKLDYNLDLISVRDRTIKMQMYKIFETKVMAIEELLHI